MGKKLVNYVIILAGILSLSLFALKGLPTLRISDEVLLSFSVTSDSQANIQDPETPVQDKKWGVNSKAFNRIVDEITEQRPDMLFFCGDGISGYTQGNRDELDNQYAFLRGIESRLFEKGIYVFPVEGNHEMQDINPKNSRTSAQVSNEEAWRENNGDILPNKELWEKILKTPFASSAWRDINFARIGDDSVSTDQSKLSYSFDLKGTHFIVVNTYAVGSESSVPLERLKEDIFDARRRGMKHIFIFGHQPAFTYKYDKDTAPRGLDLNLLSRDRFWKLINESKATYFCGHDHLFDASQPSGGEAYQIIVGPSGGEFHTQEPVTNPNLMKFSWATVKVYKSGKVHIDAYGFGQDYGKTIVLKCWELHNGY